MEQRVLPWMESLVYESNDQDPTQVFAAELLRRPGFHQVQSVGGGSLVRRPGSYMLEGRRPVLPPRLEVRASPVQRVAAPAV